MINKLINKIRLKIARKNEFSNEFLRNYFSRNYGIEVGLFSYGCFDIKRIGRNTRIGRYCSFAPTAYIFRRNHGINFLTSHPYLYNEKLEFPVKSSLDFVRCEISDDVWVGHLATILPSVKYIGRGAVIAAGAVVAHDVPAYAIVAGNPARVVKMRFPVDVIKKIESTKWWEMDKTTFAEFCVQNRNAIFSPANLTGLSE